MYRGQLDNSSPWRWLVTLEAITDDYLITPPRRPFGSWKKVANSIPLDRLVVGQLWRLPVIVELVYFGLPEEFGDLLQQRLERDGRDVFRWITGFRDRDALRADLAFRPEVKAVVEAPARVLFWGHYGMTPADVAHG